jgi:hypothetical protein
MDRPTPMKTEKALNGLYPLAADDNCYLRKKSVIAYTHRLAQNDCLSHRLFHKYLNVFTAYYQKNNYLPIKSM